MNSKAFHQIYLLDIIINDEAALQCFSNKEQTKSDVPNTEPYADDVYIGREVVMPRAGLTPAIGGDLVSHIKLIKVGGFDFLLFGLQ